uniref:Uncharacterized protein LOC114329996 n=1 Tax=Diabrotica virgifera virgifera TaxID=50390 RepID=A0A6P7FQ62_DIAVI
MTKLVLCSFSLLILVSQSATLQPAMLMALLEMLLKGLKDTQILIPSANISIPKNLQDRITGDLNLTQIHVHGLDTLNYYIKVNKLPTDRELFTRNGISINTTFDTLGLETEYILNMDLVDIVPLYGNGTFRLGFTKLALDIDVNLYDKFLKNMSMEDLNIRFYLRHSSDSEITGFWNNVKVSTLITNIINIVEPVGCMWYDYERECLDCVLSNLSQFLINNYIFKSNTTEDFIKCECLDELSFLRKIHIPSLVESWETGDYSYIKHQLLDNDEVENIYNKIY